MTKEEFENLKPGDVVRMDPNWTGEDRFYIFKIKRIENIPESVAPLVCEVDTIFVSDGRHIENPVFLYKEDVLVKTEQELAMLLLEACRD